MVYKITQKLDQKVNNLNKNFHMRFLKSMQQKRQFSKNLAVHAEWQNSILDCNTIFDLVFVQNC